MNKKIKQALSKRDLVDFEKLFASYPKKRREAILKRAKYLKAASEVRKLRKQLNISQQKLAEKMAVDREFISRIESGKQNVTLETLYRIAEVSKKEFIFHFR